MSLFPLFMQTAGLTALVVGGGEIGLRKIRLLHQAGFALRVVALEIHAEINGLLAEKPHEIHQRKVVETDLDGVDVIVAATADLELNAQLSQWARQRHVPVNVVDQPSLCSFITPAIVDRAPLKIAIASGGQSPVLARHVRTQLETFLPAQYGELAQLLSQYRLQAKQQMPDVQVRRLFWEQVLAGPALEASLRGQQAQAKAHVEAAFTAQAGDNSPVIGEVYVVGAGPGDPDLLTFRALRLMQKADIVLFDRLVNPTILDLCRRDAERLYVGKACSDHSISQDQLNHKLVSLAQQGLKVCRLKGGDPFIFGRGGEEVSELMAAGIDFQVVPGITAAAGCAAYAGIPLTHRDHAESVVFVTGHRSPDAQPTDWSAYVKPRQTLVVYMGKPGLDQTTKALQTAGMAPSTPACLISKGTLPEQQVVVSTLAHLAEHPDISSLEAPTLLIIGTVVELRDQLAWFKV